MLKYWTSARSSGIILWGAGRALHFMTKHLKVEKTYQFGTQQSLFINNVKRLNEHLFVVEMFFNVCFTSHSLWQFLITVMLRTLTRIICACVCVCININAHTVCAFISYCSILLKASLTYILVSWLRGCLVWKDLWEGHRKQSQEHQLLSFTLFQSFSQLFISPWCCKRGGYGCKTEGDPHTSSAGVLFPKIVIFLVFPEDDTLILSMCLDKMTKNTVSV